MKKLIPVLLILAVASHMPAAAQVPDPARDSVTGTVIMTGDTVEPADAVTKRTEDSVIQLHLPRKAALRSAILPGWGQAYNKKYWKIPIIYGALGTTAGVFFYNLNNYRDTRYAFRIKMQIIDSGDSTGFADIKPELKNLSPESLRYYRDQFRRDIDYSVLFFILFWGLNVVDAAVDAHLKGFDVSPDLSLKLKPGYSPNAGTTGLSLVMNIR